MQTCSMVGVAANSVFFSIVVEKKANQGKLITTKECVDIHALSRLGRDALQESP